MKASNIFNVKLGDNFDLLKRKIRDTEDIVLETLPAFCLSEFKVLRNIETNEGIYIRVNNGIVVEIVNTYEEAVDTKKANAMLKEILDNNRV